MLKLHNVSVYFKNKTGLFDINLSVEKGEFMYLVGPTGAGKTTLLRSIYMDLPLDDGTIEFAGYNSSSIKRRQIPYLRRQIGNVFQDLKLLDDRTVFDNVIFALRSAGATSRDAKKKAVKALTGVGLFSRRNNRLEELSGGELQRLCIARAIANQPQIILADEPTGNLDPGTARSIFELLHKLNQRGITILTATHNYQIIREFPGRVVYLNNGRIQNRPEPEGR